uniref:Uncharacterized protein n=1 Tax=Rhipicephalus zambeziensis TaxID=60191 RepID=A0A224YGD2_9ACAR
MQLVLLQFHSAFTIKCSLCISTGFLHDQQTYLLHKQICMCQIRKNKCLFWLLWQGCILHINVYSMDSRMCMQYTYNRQLLQTKTTAASLSN